MRDQGYSAHWPSMRWASAVARNRYDQLAEAQEELRRAFDEDRAALGDDVYGAELARKLPAIEKGIFDLFGALLDELEHEGDGLARGSAFYEVAEHSSELRT
ncbi:MULTISPECIES: hypothetical protein [unclassified Nonomuraea]|uniref:hypothetical protein n=1 Tax=unclassified Nonomuraea TaxID=2593643 RepID=UPI0033FC2584